MVEFGRPRRAHYAGDRTAAIGQVMGPSDMGEFLVVEAAEYDPDSNTTTCRFRYATEPEVATHLGITIEGTNDDEASPDSPGDGGTSRGHVDHLYVPGR